MIRNRVTTAAAILIVVLSVLVPAGPAPARAGSDEDAIRHLLHTTFDRAGALLVVAPVTVVGGHAVAGWTRDDRGGRALLRQEAAGWIVVLCSGDGVCSAEALRHAGVPAADASALADRLAAAERGVDPARLKRPTGASRASLRV